MYKVQSKVLIKDPENASGSSSLLSNSVPDFGGLLEVQNNIYNEVLILKSRDLLEKVAIDMDLTKTYINRGRIRDIEMYRKSPFTAWFEPRNDSIPLTEISLDFDDGNNKNEFKGMINDSTFVGQIGDTMSFKFGRLVLSRNNNNFYYKNYKLILNNIDATLDNLRSSLFVELKDDATTVVDLAFNTNVPRKGEELLQKLIDAYTKRNLDEKNEMSDSTIAFINERLGLVSGDLGSIESDIQQFKQNNKITDLSEQSKSLLNSSSSYYNKLNETEVQLSIVGTMLEYVNSEKNFSRPVPSLINNDPAFLLLIQQYNDLLTQKSKLLVSVKEDNPLIKNLNTQLTNLRNDIQRSLSNQQKALNISREQLINENKEISKIVFSVPKQERVFFDFSREKEIKQALYLYLLQKKEETSISKAANISNTSILERPKSAYLPYFPSPVLSLAVCIMLGILVPTMILMLREFFNNKISSREDISSKTKIPIIGEIGHSTSDGLLNLEADSRYALAEQFRVLRTKLNFINKGVGGFSILLTSTTTGEGKSFIAANLAQLYAYSGKKVLLMELDLRKPKLSKMLQRANERGFSNFAISNNDVADYLHQTTETPNLYFFNSGPIPPNPAELLMNEKVREGFKSLRKMFDIIILDTAPIGAVADAQILSEYADVCLFVIRQHISLKMSTEILNEAIAEQRLPSTYVLVNDVKDSSAYRYGYGSHYGYGYAYGSSKNSDKKNIRLSQLFKK
jgi:capsular exopolysaccharide synthesis family protein